MDLDGSLKARDLYHYSVKQQHTILEQFLKKYDYNLLDKHKISEYGNTELNVFKDFADIKKRKTII